MSDWSDACSHWTLSNGQQRLKAFAVIVSQQILFGKQQCSCPAVVQVSTDFATRESPDVRSVQQPNLSSLQCSCRGENEANLMTAIIKRNSLFPPIFG